jgi:hypothetical protein
MVYVVGVSQKLRVALVSPFLFSMAACLLLMAVALTAFGAGDEVGYPAWAPPAGAYLYAVPVFPGSAVFAAAVWGRTFRDFRLQRWRALAGLMAILVVIAITIAYAALINEPDSYRGQFDERTQRWEPNLTLESFLSFSLLMAVFFPCGGLAVIIKVLYLDAIQAVGRALPEGVDPIGEILRTKPSA